jgi:hypothetical protein
LESHFEQLLRLGELSAESQQVAKSDQGERPIGRATVLAGEEVERCPSFSDRCREIAEALVGGGGEVIRARQLSRRPADSELPDRQLGVA